MDHRQPRLGGEFDSIRACTTPARNTCSATRSKRAAARQDGEQVLDILARHPSTAKFIATKLARRFVSDEPPQALIDRAAKRFLDTNGDLREVVRTIVESPEFFAPEARRAKVKTPFEFVVSALRASSAEVQGGTGLIRALQQLGMPLYQAQPPTGYADTADAWVNTGGLVSRMNFRRRAWRKPRCLASRRRSSDKARIDALGAAARRNSNESRVIMISRRIFIRNGGLALVSLGFAPSFLARTVEAAGTARGGRCWSRSFSAAPWTD